MTRRSVWVDFCKLFSFLFLLYYLISLFNYLQLSHINARSWNKTVLSNRAKVLTTFATLFSFSFSTQISFPSLYNQLRTSHATLGLLSLRQTNVLALSCIVKSLLLFSHISTGFQFHCSKCLIYYKIYSSGQSLPTTCCFENI